MRHSTVNHYFVSESCQTLSYWILPAFGWRTFFTLFKPLISKHNPKQKQCFSRPAELNISETGIVKGQKCNESRISKSKEAVTSKLYGFPY